MRIDAVDLKKIGLLLLLFFLPFFHKFSTLFIVFTALTCVVYYVGKRQWPDFTRVNIFLPLLFVYYVTSILISGGKLAALEKASLYLAVPMIFILAWPHDDASFRKKGFCAFVFGNLSALVICIVRAVYRSISMVDGSIIFSSKVTSGSSDDVLTSVVMDGNFFFGYELSWFLATPTYFAMFLCFAQYLTFEIFIRSAERKKWFWFTTVYLIFSVGIFLLSSKAGIISSVVLSIVVTFLTVRTITSSWPARISVAAGIGLTLVGVFVSNPRVKMLAETLRSGTSINATARFNDDIRFLTWDASITILRDHWLTGVGEANKRSALLEVYSQKGYSYPFEKGLNSHNQYFDLMLGGGVFAIALFAVGIIFFFIQACRQKDIAMIVFLCLIAFNSLFENILMRHSGVLFFAVLFTLLSSPAGRKTTDIRTGQIF